MAFVFLVHRFETTDERHHLTYSNGKRERTCYFNTWEFAERVANHKAKQLGLEEYQVDEPNRIHTIVKVRD